MSDNADMADYVIEAMIQQGLSQHALPKGDSAEFCDDCGDPIPVQRQQALRGVRHCIQCQSDKEATAKHWRH